jgi:hypothetical protein
MKQQLESKWKMRQLPRDVNETIRIIIVVVQQYILHRDI